jgi:hypothetical protein
MPCGSCKNRFFGGTYHLVQLLVTADIFLNSVILFTLVMKDTRSSDALFLTIITRCLIQEHCCLHRYRRENFKPHLVHNSIPSG